MIRLSSGLRRAVVSTTGLGSMLNGGYIAIYGGAQPESADAGATTDPLALITQDGAMSPAARGLLLAQGEAAGTLTHSGLWILTGLTAGIAAWWRFMGDPYDTGTETVPILPRLDGPVGEGLEATGLPVIVPESIVEVQRFLLTLPANV